MAAKPDVVSRMCDIRMMSELDITKEDWVDNFLSCTVPEKIKQVLRSQRLFQSWLRQKMTSTADASKHTLQVGWFRNLATAVVKGQPQCLFMQHTLTAGCVVYFPHILKTSCSLRDRRPEHPGFTNPKDAILLWYKTIESFMVSGVQKFEKFRNWMQ